MMNDSKEHPSDEAPIERHWTRRLPALLEHARELYSKHATLPQAFITDLGRITFRALEDNALRIIELKSMETLLNFTKERLDDTTRGNIERMLEYDELLADSRKLVNPLDLVPPSDAARIGRWWTDMNHEPLRALNAGMQLLLWLHSELQGPLSSPLTFAAAFEKLQAQWADDRRREQTMTGSCALKGCTGPKMTTPGGNAVSRFCEAHYKELYP